jgi:hypothetical protein
MCGGLSAGREWLCPDGAQARRMGMIRMGRPSALPEICRHSAHHRLSALRAERNTVFAEDPTAIFQRRPLRADATALTTRAAMFLPALVRIIIRMQLLQRHQDHEKDAHPYAHRCCGYPEGQILRHCLLPAHFGGNIAQVRDDRCPQADIYVSGLPINRSVRPIPDAFCL